MTIDHLKTITEIRMKSVEVLMGGEDWFWASIAMATALECALKAMICKTLGLSIYPEDKKQEQVVTFFRTHEFQRLLILSGLNSVFGPDPGATGEFQSWSDFTKQFPGNWAEMKYDLERQVQFDATKASFLYKSLTDPTRGVLTIIKRRW